MHSTPPSPTSQFDSAPANGDQEVILALQAKVVSLEETIASQQEELSRCEGIIARLQRQLFGRSSEKQPEFLSENEQPLLGFEAAALDARPTDAPTSEAAAEPAEAAAEAAATTENGAEADQANEKPKKPRKPYTPRRSLILTGLRRVVEEVIPNDVLEHPENFMRIGQDETEILERSRAEFFVRCYVRGKYVPIDAESKAAAEDGDASATAPIIAPLPTLFEHSYASASMLSYIAVSHYADHLPYYRIEAMLQRDGIHLPRAQMCRWIGQLVHTYLEPIVAAILTEIFLCAIVMMDETPVRYLPPKKKTLNKLLENRQHGGVDPAAPDPPPSPTAEPLEAEKELSPQACEQPPSTPAKKTKQGYLWVTHAPGVGTYFDWNKSRAHTVPNNLIPANWRGHIVCDDYAAYRTVATLRTAEPEKYGKIILCSCMVHVRRKFIEAQSQAPKETTHVLKEIQKLYAIEEKLREKKASVATILATRQAECQPIFDSLKTYLENLRKSPSHLPRSSLGTAVRYALNQWTEFAPYLSNGEIPLDNNATERAIRPTAVGKKNWLFFGTGESGRTGAMMYTLIETAKVHKLEPQAYLESLIQASPTMKMSDVASWTPKAYAARQAAAKAATATEAASQEQATSSEATKEKEKEKEKAPAKPEENAAA